MGRIAGHKQAMTEIERLSEELEQPVLERTSQLMLASETFRETELAHVNRVTTTGRLAASIAHEVIQPLSGMVTNADAALNWLGGQPPNLEKVRYSLDEIIKDGNRARDLIGRVRALVKKSTSAEG